MTTNDPTFERQMKIIAYISMGVATFLTIMFFVLGAFFHIYFHGRNPSPLPDNWSPAIRWQIEHFEISLSLAFMLAATVLISSIGLLRRHLWAIRSYRITLSAIVILGAIFTVCLWLGHEPPLSQKAVFTALNVLIEAILVWLIAVLRSAPTNLTTR
jgi:hypothetical protein